PFRNLSPHSGPSRTTSTCPRQSSSWRKLRASSCSNLTGTPAMLQQAEAPVNCSRLHWSPVHSESLWGLEVLLPLTVGLECSPDSAFGCTTPMEPSSRTAAESLKGSATSIVLGLTHAGRTSR